MKFTGINYYIKTQEEKLAIVHHKKIKIRVKTVRMSQKNKPISI